jgi:3',5'-cyclic AMP phosphodiesterase CpdA
VLLCSSQDLGFRCRVQFTQSLRSKVGGFVPFTVASGNTDIHPANFLAGREIDREYIGEKLLDRQRIDSSFVSILEICLQAAVLFFVT